MNERNRNQKKIRDLREQVLFCLHNFPATRNSDIILTVSVWKQFHGGTVARFQGLRSGSNYYENLISILLDLPREDNVKRIRADITNDKDKPISERYLPTVWDVAKRRKILRSDWELSLNYNPVNEAPGNYAGDAEIKKDIERQIQVDKVDGLDQVRMGFELPPKIKTWEN